MRYGSHRSATVAMYTNILKIILPQFQGVPLDEITGVRISQYLRWLRNDYRKPDGKPLAEKSIKHHYNVLNLIFGFAERQVPHNTTIAKKAKNGNRFSNKFFSHLLGSGNAILSRLKCKHFMNLLQSALSVL
ncbi:MAG: hypothetical protein ACI3V5_01925 [Faecousia sp.]